MWFNLLLPVNGSLLESVVLHFYAFARSVLIFVPAMEGEYAVPGKRKRAHVHDNGPSDPQPVAQVNPFNVLNWDDDGFIDT